MNVNELNREGWNRRAEEADIWTRPFDSETIARARKGDWEVVLTPLIPVPRAWFGDIAGKDVLGLASGGGQQVPIFAAAGANVTSFDASDAQLAADRMVAEREGLTIRTVQGYMHDLSALEDDSFDLIFHPCSNSYAPEVLPVWKECARVLRPGGVLLVGITKPEVFIFDLEPWERGELVAKHKLPYSDFDLPKEELEPLLARDHTASFSHTLETQLGGQMAAGFMLTDLFEDFEPEGEAPQLFAPYIATRAVLRD
ncbi:class I SAM-dependent methyltransferase [Croceicoccus gelatinilyticus]|uniref:class I SAM-dependent methyltransferase n=1 Tax=Croceicoccus gelatinilyticus TaxID=2835536 RepID=UPI001BD0FA3E|nr:class I SAM-dependent methyltransferase [Croceicoccus gelatinilyticus]MBS7670565.1 class I SAM-dependent methyltransferase [Croceicoccus gelatinilyticus]